MEREELEKILGAHELWLQSGGKQGRRAELIAASLNDANSRAAILARQIFKAQSYDAPTLPAHKLRHTNLREADLQNANLDNR